MILMWNLPLLNMMQEMLQTWMKLCLEVGTVVFDDAVQIEPGLELDGKLYSLLYIIALCVIIQQGRTITSSQAILFTLSSSTSCGERRLLRISATRHNRLSFETRACKWNKFSWRVDHANDHLEGGHCFNRVSVNKSMCFRLSHNQSIS